MATLLSLCQDALNDVDGFELPSSIIGNTDPTAVLLLSLATRVGRELEREVKWAALETAYSFATVAATAAYDLPEDYRRFVNQTIYNVSEEQPLIGPVSGMLWADLTRGSFECGFLYSYRVKGNRIHLTPTPTDVQTVGFDYYSKYFCTDDDGVAQAGWLADTDLFRLDEELATLGISYRFKARKGLPFAEEKADYVAAVSALKFDETPKAIIDVSGVPRYAHSNIPSRNWG